MGSWNNVSQELWLSYIEAMIHGTKVYWCKGKYPMPYYRVCDNCKNAAGCEISYEQLYNHVWRDKDD